MVASLLIVLVVFGKRTLRAFPVGRKLPTIGAAGNASDRNISLN
jgi:hypothetical protein